MKYDMKGKGATHTVERAYRVAGKKRSVIPPNPKKNTEKTRGVLP